MASTAVLDMNEIRRRWISFRAVYAIVRNYDLMERRWIYAFQTNYNLENYSIILGNLDLTRRTRDDFLRHVARILPSSTTLMHLHHASFTNKHLCVMANERKARYPMGRRFSRYGIMNAIIRDIAYRVKREQVLKSVSLKFSVQFHLSAHLIKLIKEYVCC